MKGSLRAETDLFVKLSLHQETAHKIHEPRSQVYYHILYTICVPSSTLNLWNRAHYLSLLDVCISLLNPTFLSRTSEAYQSEVSQLSAICH